MQKKKKIFAGLAACFVGTLLFAFVVKNALIGPVAWGNTELDTTSADTGVATTSADSEIAVPSADHGLPASRNRRSLPQKLIIPSIGINANIQDVGIGKSGNMAVPTNYVDVGWYRYGPIPGEEGSAVMDGHVDNGLSLAGVFKRLGELNDGDTVIIQYENGETATFAVTAVDIYDYKSAPVNDIFRQNGPPALRLITCDGTWVAGERTYDKRLVVTARPISS